MEGPLSHAPSIPFPMPDEPARLGDCPDCGENIAPAWTLVEYERSDGSEAVWAECPACEAVVEPE